MKVIAASEPLPELAEFLAPYAHHFVRSETREDLERYMTGHLSDIPKKNSETIAKGVPNTSEQRLQELLTGCVWDETALNTQRVQQMRDTIRLSDGVLIFDDTGFPKQGTHSVGVARQYCGCLGKIANCQVAVTCVYADVATHWPVTVRLYLPSEWTDDKERCARAGVPDDVTFQTKPQIALALLDYARAMYIPHSAVIADSNYGGDSTFLSGLEERGEQYITGIPCDFRIIPFDEFPRQPVRADDILRAVPRAQWKTIRWREGGKGWLRKKFLAIRAYRSLSGQPLTLGWLCGERPARGQEGDWKYYFSNFSADTPLETLVGYIHQRWQIERFHQDSKQLLGWDDYQGRLFQGFHRNSILVMLAYSFLVHKEWHHRQQAPRMRGRPRAAFSHRRDKRRQALAAVHRQIVDAFWEMVIREQIQNRVPFFQQTQRS
jgi:SRSO17 transposase